MVNRSRYQTVLVVGVLLCLAGMLVVSQLKTTQHDAARLDAVVASLKSGATTHPYDGRLILEGTANSLTEDGIAYVTGAPAEFVLFPSWRGPGTKLAGHLWTHAPLEVGQQVELLVPRTPKAAEPAAKASFAPTTRRSVLIKDRLRPEWYRVERDEE
jgi:glutamine synthetase